MLFIFDWDGTLIDSTGKIIRCMREAINTLQLEDRSDHEVKQIIGLGLPEAIRQLFPDISDADLQRLRELYSANYVEADQTPCEFYPGVMAALDTLRGDGHHLSVATGKSRRGLNRVLGNLEMVDYFDASRCADETASKPHPLMLHQLLKELQVRPEEAVMIGDTEFDLEMANNAGIDGIGVSYGAHNLERLRACNPVQCIDHFDELLEWFERR